jgi:RecB family endonuclease NucS
MTLRRAAKVDANQGEVVEALRRCGVQVEIIGFPVDLLCCDQRGKVHLVEVKTGEGRLTKQQVEFIARWPGQVHIVRGAKEAVETVLGIATNAQERS